MGQAFKQNAVAWGLPQVLHVVDIAELVHSCGASKRYTSPIHPPPGRYVGRPGRKTV